METGVGPFTLGQLLICFGIILLTFFLRRILARMIFASLKRLASKTKWTYDDKFLDALETPTSSFILVTGIYMAIVTLPLGEEWGNVTSTLYRGASIFIVFWGLFRLADVLVDLLGHLSKSTGNDSFSGFGDLVKKSLRVFIIVVGVVMVIDNLGYNIGGILATLGELLGGSVFARTSLMTTRSGACPGSPGEPPYCVLPRQR